MAPSFHTLYNLLFTIIQSLNIILVQFELLRASLNKHKEEHTMPSLKSSQLLSWSRNSPLSCDFKVHYYVHQGLSPDPIQSQFDPLYPLTLFPLDTF
jgi:hypothetical protein